MRLPSTLLAIVLAASSFVSAQTSTTCNPLSQTCPADPALGRTATFDLTSAPSDFAADGSEISYSSSGVQMTVAQSGNSPTFISDFYIMFGRVDIVMQCAPGVGMVSTLVLESDDLDEIDWEMLGSQPGQAQTNYFGKGQTGSYNRGLTVTAAGTTTQFNTYSVDWNADRIIWEVNGVALRQLNYADADGQYPQTPMKIKFGAWAPGDPSNAPGTVAWAGGSINYSDGPFVMQVKSATIQDYSTGSEYKYGDNSGSWQSIIAVGGTVNSGGSSGSTGTPAYSSPSMVTSVPGAEQTTFQGTHKDSSSAAHTGWPWVSTETTAVGGAVTTGTFAGFGAYTSAAATTMVTSTGIPSASSAQVTSSPFATAAPGVTADRNTSVRVHASLLWSVLSFAISCFVGWSL